MFLANVIGYLGADAEVKTADGREFVTFRIAHTRKYKDAQGTIHESTQWIDCVISGRPNVTQYLHKGTQVYVSGSVELRIYDSAKDHCKKPVCKFVSNLSNYSARLTRIQTSRPVKQMMVHTLNSLKLKMHPSKLDRSRSVFLERLSSFLQDGYEIRTNAVGLDESFWHVKLVHHNGNRVSILASTLTNSIEVRKTIR